LPPAPLELPSWRQSNMRIEKNINSAEEGEKSISPMRRDAL
jgi:hypothetical protein